MQRIAKLGSAACLAGLLTGVAGAAVIEPGLYELHNHPDGNQAPPTYGLRLDELADVTPDTDVFTFDFDADGADMQLSYDGTSIHIFGIAFGGLDTGNGYDPDNSGFVEIDFTYDLTAPVPGDDDIEVTTASMTNSGTLTWIDTQQIIELRDKTAAETGNTFRLGDEDDDLGHRGFDGISGWGWLVHGGQSHPGSSDWLFTATPIPAPGVLALFGLFGLAGRRRRG